MLPFLSLSVAYRLPAAARPPAAARTCVTMGNPYLDSTIAPKEPSEGETKTGSRSYLDSTIGTRDMSSMEGKVVPSAPGFAAVPPPVYGARPGEPVAVQMVPMVPMWTAAPPNYVTPPPPAVAPPATNYIAPAPEPEQPLSTRAVRVLGPLALAAGAAAGTLAFTKVTAPAPITLEEIVTVQKEWGDAIVRISKTWLAGGDYEAAALKAADELYGYGRTDVLFKPTKASVEPFRPTAEGAMSYFIGGSKNKDFDEDHGFALGPDGVGWRKVVFDNHKIDYNGATAQAMGEYYFTSAKDGKVAKVEYTFGYKRNDDGKIRIYLHHSSLPYAAKAAAPAPITLEEITSAQREWGDSIVRISKVWLAGGDYAAEAAKAADALYGYGRTDVLFKPTKAAREPFRPTAEGAMSYFIGGSDNKDFDEDHGFALGPDGVGWRKVVFDNNKIDLNGATAQAMGEYYFYSAADDSVAKVEYTFGYKRNDDGKMRIYLHHSSLPYKPKA